MSPRLKTRLRAPLSGVPPDLENSEVKILLIKMLSFQHYCYLVPTKYRSYLGTYLPVILFMICF